MPEVPVYNLIKFVFFVFFCCYRIFLVNKDIHKWSKLIPLHLRWWSHNNKKKQEKVSKGRRQWTRKTFVSGVGTVLSCEVVVTLTCETVTSITTRSTVTTVHTRTETCKTTCNYIHSGPGVLTVESESLIWKRLRLRALAVSSGLTFNFVAVYLTSVPKATGQQKHHKK